jgi:hypothetical protein
VRDRKYQSLSEYHNFTRCIIIIDIIVDLLACPVLDEVSQTPWSSHVTGPADVLYITQFFLHLWAEDILANQLYGFQSCTNYKQPNIFIAPLVDDVLLRNYLKTLCALLMSQFSESQVSTLQYQCHPMFSETSGARSSLRLQNCWGHGLDRAG